MQCLPVLAHVKYTQNIAPVCFCNFELENFSLYVLCIMYETIRLRLVNFICIFMHIVS